MAKKEITTIDLGTISVTTPTLYTVTLRGMDGILFNKMADQSVPKSAKKEQAKMDDLEREQTFWREKLYVLDGEIFIPGENLHQSMCDGAQYWGCKIPGEGNKTYTDVVKSATVVESMMLGIRKDSDKIVPFGKSCNGKPSGGKKSGSRVYKIRPLLRPWGGSFQMHVFDARLTPAVLKVILTYAGTFRGLGDWRPSFGRYEVVSISEV